MTDEPLRDGARDVNAHGEHYRLMQSRTSEQRDHQRAIHERLTATLQLDSIIVAVLIAVILVQADRSDLGTSIGIPVSISVGYLIASICSAVGGLLSRGLRVLPRPADSRLAAADLGRTDYLIWAASEMQRAYGENEIKLARRSLWATMAMILAVVAAVMAGMTVIRVVVW